MNSSLWKHEFITCGFIKAIFFRDHQELVMNIFTCAFNILFAITAILFNSVVLLAIWKTRSPHTPSNILLCGLAASDLAVGFLIQPLYVTTKLLEIRQHLQPYCLLRITTETFTLIVSGTSFLTLTIIAVERYLALYLHLRYKAIVTCKRMWMCLAVSWLLPIAGALTRFWLNSQIFTAVTGSVITACLLLNIWAYTQIFRFVERHKTQIENITSVLRTSRSKVEMSKYNRTVVTMMIILFILVVSYVSFVCVTNALAFGFSGKNTRELLTAYMAVANWIFITSSLNPVLYCWRLKEIRQAVTKVVFKERQ